MTAHPSLDDIARLLDRLDPRPAGTCRVPGCRHDAHETGAARSAQVPLAA
jgi:hypothetical protein